MTKLLALPASTGIHSGNQSKNDVIMSAWSKSTFRLTAFTRIQTCHEELKPGVGVPASGGGTRILRLKPVHQPTREPTVGVATTRAGHQLNPSLVDQVMLALHCIGMGQPFFI